MKVTEQIDAMEASAVDPHKFLAATRILACTLALPLLTLAADFFGIMMGWVATTLAEPVSLKFFLRRGLAGASFNDLFPPTLKTMVFVFIIGAVKESGGRPRARFFSSLFIILADILLVRLIVVFFS
jgi:phospholipid/cholesterol/gamma-HCH transport system permease protein